MNERVLMNCWRVTFRELTSTQLLRSFRRPTFEIDKRQFIRNTCRPEAQERESEGSNPRKVFKIASFMGRQKVKAA